MVENVFHHTIWFIVWKLLWFPAMNDIFRLCSEIVLVGHCVPILLKMAMKTFWLIFSISTQIHSDCPEYLEVFCAGLAIFAISLLLLMIFPSIWVVLPKSSKYSMYSIVAADPAVSCKKNRSSLMNFPIIRGFPKREHVNVWKYLWLYRCDPVVLWWSNVDLSITRESLLHRLHVWF